MVIPIAGGIGLATRTADGLLTPQGFFPELVRAAGQAAWTTYRERLAQLLRDELGLGDRIGPGVTLYELVVDVARDVDLSVERDAAGDLVVHLTTGGSYLEATSTTPTALGEWADPRFSFAFGLDLTCRIDLPPTTQPLHSTGFESVHIVSPVLDSHNFVADVVFLANDLLAFFTGRNYLALLERFIAETDFAPYLNDALAPLNAELTRLAAEGFWFLEAVVDQLDGASRALRGLSLPGAAPQRLDLLLTAYGFDRSGAVEGLITWPAPFGDPTNRREFDLADAVREVSAVQLSSATTAALLSERTATWSAPITAAPAADPSDSTVAASLEALPVQERVVAAQELRSGVAERYITLVGGTERFAELREEFLRGRTDLALQVTTAVGGSGLFAESRPVGRVASLWSEDDATTHRRRYLVVDVPVDAPLTVQCTLAHGYRWSGGQQVVCTPDGWSGAVTVRPAVDRTRALEDLVEVRLTDRTRRFGKVSDLEQSGIIVGGRAGAGEQVQLNPQPLPPKEIDLDEREWASQRVSRSAMRVSGSEGIAARISDSLASDAVVHASAAQDSRWGNSMIELDSTVSELAAVALQRDNPSGAGTVRGIDFAVKEYVPPVIR